MPRPQSTKGPTQRQLRAGELIRHALAGIFATEDIEDDALKGVLVTVAEVRLSPDLKNATVFVACMGAQKNEEAATALGRHTRFLRGELAKKIELRYVPQLAFRGDGAVDAAGRVEALLRSPDVARDLK